MKSIMKQFTLLFKNSTGLHMGAENELGYIDLPIQREHITGFPKMEATGIKGTLVDMDNEKKFGLLFGSSEETEETKGGKLRIHDGRLLLFPIKSTEGFCWITCPFVLKKFLEECKENIREYEELKILLTKIEELEEDKALAEKERNIVLGDFTYKGKKEELIPRIKIVLDVIWEEDTWLKDKNIVIVSDDAFSYFVEMNTEVRTRNVIDDETGTAKNLFTVEYLPEESVLYSVLEYPSLEQNSDEVKGCNEKEDKKAEDKMIKEKIKELKEIIRETEYFQFGGEESVGKGITKVKIMDEVEKNAAV